MMQRPVVVILGRRSSCHSGVIREWGKEYNNKLQIYNTYL